MDREGFKQNPKAPTARGGLVPALAFDGGPQAYAQFCGPTQWASSLPVLETPVEPSAAGSTESDAPLSTKSSSDCSDPQNPNSWDELERSVKDCTQHLSEPASLKVQFVSLQDSGIDTSPSGTLLLHLLAAFADFEAVLIKERVTAGVRAKIAKTGKWGPARKRDDQAILELRAKGLSVRQIAKRLGVSATSVMRTLQGVPGTLQKVRN